MLEAHWEPILGGVSMLAFMGVLVVGWPAVARAMLRHDLHTLHDEIFQAAAEGRISIDDAPCVHLREMVRSSIQNVPAMTLLHAVLVRKILGMQADACRDQFNRSLDSPTYAAKREAYLALSRNLDAIISRHLIRMPV